MGTYLHTYLHTPTDNYVTGPTVSLPVGHTINIIKGITHQPYVQLSFQHLTGNSLAYPILQTLTKSATQPQRTAQKRYALASTHTHGQPADHCACPFRKRYQPVLRTTRQPSIVRLKYLHPSH